MTTFRALGDGDRSARHGSSPTRRGVLVALAVLLILAGAGGLIAQRMSRKRKEAAGGDPPTGDTGTPETAG